MLFHLNIVPLMGQGIRGAPYNVSLIQRRNHAKNLTDLCLADVRLHNRVVTRDTNTLNYRLNNNVE